MARAMLKRRIDDEFSVETPGGRINLVILDVTYTEPQDAENS